MDRKRNEDGKVFASKKRWRNFFDRKGFRIIQILLIIQIHKKFQTYGLKLS